MVTKRQAEDVSKNRKMIQKCSAIKSPAGRGLHTVKEVDLLQYNFFIQPEPGFRRLVVRMKIDNLLNSDGPYTTSERVTFNNWELKATDSDWVEVSVEYAEHEIFGPNRHSLIVMVENLERRSLVTAEWHWTHSYEGMVIEVEGPANLLFNNCYPPEPSNPIHHHVQATHKPKEVTSLHKPLLIGGVLSGAFLLVATACLVYLVLTRRNQGRDHRHQDDQPPIVPPLPKSLVSGRLMFRKTRPSAQKEDTVSRLVFDADSTYSGHYLREFLISVLQAR